MAFGVGRGELSAEHLQTIGREDAGWLAAKKSCATEVRGRNPYLHMATALVSLLTDRPERPLTAMTGEITLSGNVLPVGGIKEKVLAAKRAGVRDVILPAENRTNVEEDLTEEQLQGLNVHYVKLIDEVLSLALPSSAREEKQDAEERDKVLNPVG